MNYKLAEKNYKIYAFILGIITGTLVYNFLGIDFSFNNVENIKFNNLFDGIIYVLLGDVKFLLGIFILSFFRIKDKIVPVFVFYFAFVLAGIITVSVSSHTLLLVGAGIDTMAKIIGTVYMCDGNRKNVGRGISFLILIISSLLQNCFIF